jgi:hypothetical protein
MPKKINTYNETIYLILKNYQSWLTLYTMVNTTCSKVQMISEVQHQNKDNQVTYKSNFESLNKQ